MPKYFIQYKKNAHQEEYHQDITTKFLHLSTGFGGGKSYALCMKSFQLSQINMNIPGGCVVPSIADYKKDLLPLYEEILELNGIRYRYHKTDKWFRFPWTRAKMYVETAEKRIRGPNWGWAVINEVTLLKHSSYKETIGRVRIRSTPHPQIASGGTPEGTSHWLYEKFIEEPMDRSRVIFGDTRANQMNLNEDYVPTLEASYDAIMLDAYLRGLFVNMNGHRFYYAYDPKMNDRKDIEQIEGAEVYVSLDYNVSPMIATLWNIVFVNKKHDGHIVPILNPHTGQPEQAAIAFDSIVIEDGADTLKMCSAFREYGLDPDTTTIFPDPAGKSRATNGPPDNVILKNEGWYKIKTRLAAPRFRKRQLAVNNLLAKGRIRLHPIRCKTLKKDLEAVEQDTATYEKIKTNPKLTHASDGMDYFIDLMFPLSGQKPDSRSTKYR